MAGGRIGKVDRQASEGGKREGKEEGQGDTAEVNEDIVGLFTY